MHASYTAVGTEYHHGNSTKNANYFVITLDCGATGFVGLTAAADVTGMICPVSDSMRAPMILPLSLFVGSTASTPSRIGMLPGAAKIRAQRKTKACCVTLVRKPSANL